MNSWEHLGGPESTWEGLRTLGSTSELLKATNTHGFSTDPEHKHPQTHFLSQQTALASSGLAHSRLMASSSGTHGHLPGIHGSSIFSTNLGPSPSHHLHCHPGLSTPTSLPLLPEQALPLPPALSQSESLSCRIDVRQVTDGDSRVGDGDRGSRCACVIDWPEASRPIELFPQTLTRKQTPQKLTLT